MAGAALCALALPAWPLDTPTADLEDADGADVVGDGVHHISGEKLEWVADYWLDVEAMQPTIGRRYSSHRRQALWLFDDTAALDSTSLSRAPEYEAAPYSPGWTTFLDVRLFRITMPGGNQRRLAVNMVPGPWYFTGKRLSFRAFGDDFRSTLWQPRYYARAGLEPGYQPPKGTRVLENLPNGHSLEPSDVAYTMTFFGECSIYFDGFGRVAGAQDFEGNGYAYDWETDDEISEDGVTTQRRDMTIQHTQGAFATVAYRRITDRTATDPSQHFTDTTLEVQVGDDGPTITYTYARTFPNDPTWPTELITEAKVVLLRGLEGQPTKGSVMTYEYAAEDIFRFPEDPALPGQPLVDPLLPDDRPNRLLALKREGEIVRGRVEWQSHARFSYRWLPGNADIAMGRRAPSLRPVCTSSRSYWGVPPKVTPYDRADIGYGSAIAPGDWTWDSSQRLVATYNDGTLQGTSEYLVTVEDFGILEQHSPSKEFPSWSRYSWWDFHSTSFNMRFLGSTTVRTPDGAQPTYEHLYFVYATPYALQRESCFIVETGSLGRESPYDTWKDARNPRYRMANGKYEWYAHDLPNIGGLMQTRTDGRGTQLRFEYADEDVPHGRLVRLYESGKAPGASVEPVTIAYDEPGAGVPNRRGLPTSLIVPPLGDPSKDRQAKAVLSWDSSGRLESVALADDDTTSPLLALAYDAEGKLVSVQHGTAAPKAVRLRSAFDSAWGECLRRVFDAAGGRRQREASRLYLQKYLIGESEEEEAAAE